MKIFIVLALAAVAVSAAETEKYMDLGERAIPTNHLCELRVAPMEPEEFVMKALGGEAGCVDAEDKAQCCSVVHELFGKDGRGAYCLCNKEFFSSLVMGLPAANGVQPDKYSDMLVSCGVPVAGQLSCPGTTKTEEVEPLVKGQIITSLILSRLIGGGSPPAAPAPAPTPTPAPAPKPAMPSGPVGIPVKVGKIAAPAKKYVVATEAKVVAPAPAPQQVVIEEPVAPPVVAPKATAVATPPTPIAPKATAQPEPPMPAPPMPAPPVPAPPVPQPPVETPEVVEETPEVVEETPEVVEETPEVVEETPEVVEETPEVVKEETPEVVAETPEVVAETPEVVAETPEVVAETPEVVAETPEVVAETPEVVAETPEVVAETPEAGDCKSPVELAKENSELSTLVQLIEATGLGGALGKDFSGTVFAPNNAAFTNLLNELKLDIAVLLDPRSKNLVTKILNLHVVAGSVVRAGDLQDGQSITTLLGAEEALTVSTSNGVSIKGPGNSNGAQVLIPDVEACNAVVHVLGDVLIPSPQVTASAGLQLNIG